MHTVIHPSIVSCERCVSCILHTEKRVVGSAQVRHYAVYGTVLGTWVMLYADMQVRGKSGNGYRRGSGQYVSNGTYLDLVGSADRAG